MSTFHICTPESFLVNAPIIESECPLCLVICDQEIGWVGDRCSNCRHIYSFDDISRLVRSRREDILKMSRKEMSVATGYSPATIKKYEWGYCTLAYFDKSAEAVKALKGVINGQ